MLVSNDGSCISATGRHTLAIEVQALLRCSRACTNIYPSAARVAPPRRKRHVMLIDVRVNRAMIARPPLVRAPTSAEGSVLVGFAWRALRLSHPV